MSPLIGQRCAQLFIVQPQSRKRHQDWFDCISAEIHSVLHGKHEAHNAFLCCPGSSTLESHLCCGEGALKALYSPRKWTIPPVKASVPHLPKWWSGGVAPLVLRPKHDIVESQTCCCSNNTTVAATERLEQKPAQPCSIVVQQEKNFSQALAASSARA